MKNNNSESFFAELCQYTYLRGFTFHSPKIYDPTEKELGDVIVWVRTQLFVFEIIWRAKKTGDTKSFIKRIGEKRDQLLKDFENFSKQKKVSMTNQSKQVIEYQSEYFVPENFFGVIVVDCDTKLEKIHFGTLRTMLESKFPIAVITKQDFHYILKEVDTSSDLKFYLRDRFAFFKEVFPKHASYFLDLNPLREKQLIAFYKMNNYSFPLNRWNPAYNYWDDFQVRQNEEIVKRDEENELSKIIDRLIDSILRSSQSELPLVHAWQLAVIPRRARAIVLAPKIIDALFRMHKGNEQRHFSLKNPMTGCWMVFYFYHGESSDFVKQKIERLTKLKLILEISENLFQHSVIGYGFRKFKATNDSLVDEIVLVVEDAINCSEIKPEQIKEAKKFFRGITSVKHFNEFPDKQ